MQPRLTEMYWYLTFKHGLSLRMRLMAANSLAGTDTGIRWLKATVLSSDVSGQNHSIAVSVLAATLPPWATYSMLGPIRKAGRCDEYVELIHSLDYSEEHQQVLNALRNEYKSPLADVAAQRAVVDVLGRFAAVDDTFPLPGPKPQPRQENGAQIR